MFKLYNKTNRKYKPICPCVIDVVKEKQKLSIHKIRDIAVNCDFQYSLQCVVVLFLFPFYRLQDQLIKSEKLQLEKPPT